MDGLHIFPPTVEGSRITSLLLAWQVGGEKRTGGAAKGGDLFKQYLNWPPALWPLSSCQLLHLAHTLVGSQAALSSVFKTYELDHITLYLMPSSCCRSQVNLWSGSGLAHCGIQCLMDWSKGQRSGLPVVQHAKGPNGWLLNHGLLGFFVLQ